MEYSTTMKKLLNTTQSQSHNNIEQKKPDTKDQMQTIHLVYDSISHKTENQAELISNVRSSR